MPYRRWPRKERRAPAKSNRTDPKTKEALSQHWEGAFSFKIGASQEKRDVSPTPCDVLRRFLRLAFPERAERRWRAPGR